MTDKRERDLHDVAEETSRRIQPHDPYTEPPNSTVDDWFGQRVARDMEAADTRDEEEAAERGEAAIAMAEADIANGEGDPDSPGRYVNDPDAEEIPEPNEPA